MTLKPFKRFTTIEGRVWLLVISGLLAGTVLSMVFLAQERSHADHAQELSHSQLEAQQLHLQFSNNLTQRARALTNLATNPRDDDQARIDMADYIRYGELHDKLHSRVEQLS